ncbi:MAG: dipeptide ABC transporter ATP-binding protein [Elainellaceae cyanobacterium]
MGTDGRTAATAARTSTQALLQVSNLRVAYPRRSSNLQSAPVDAAADSAPLDWAVDGVSFDLMPGERLGLVGESGCGKSTLGRAAMRLLPGSARVAGDVRYEGRSVLEFSPDQMRRFRGEAIALIFQDPMTRLDPLMTIGEHCIETLQAHQPHLSRTEAQAKAIATLETVSIPASRWGQYPHEFSGGMRQRVAIALALLLDPKLIVADEPTTSLDVTVSAQIMQELVRLCEERHMALLLISHDLAMVGEYCNRLAVMLAGKLVEIGEAHTVLTQPQHDYTRSLLTAALDLQSGRQSATPEINAATPPLLQVHDLKQHYTLGQPLVARLLNRAQDRTIKAVDGVSLDLYLGEILGLVGESGCGKSTLSRTVLQLIRPTAGRVEFLGQNLTHFSRAAMQAQRRQMQMVFQDPHACLNPLMTVGQSIADPLRIHHLADASEASEQVNQMLERVGLTPPEAFINRYPGELSGGQQQRVAIARALITRPKLLICDEPVSMLDASIQTQVLNLMLELKQEFNLTYLFITHDLWVARFFCDRIAVMYAGKIVELGRTADLFDRPQHPYTQTLLGAAPRLVRLAAPDRPRQRPNDPPVGDNG